MTKEFISAKGSRKIWLRLGVVVWTSYKDDFALVSYADQNNLEIVRAKVYIYDACDSKPTLSAYIVKNGDFIHLLHVSPSTNHGDVVPDEETSGTDIYIISNDRDVNLKGVQTRSDNWQAIDDGILLERYFDGSDEWMPTNRKCFLNIHTGGVIDMILPQYLRDIPIRYERAFGFRWILPLKGDSITFFPVVLAPSPGTVYLQNAGWWWRGGTYNGLTTNVETYHVGVELTGEVVGRGLYTGKDPCLFPSPEPSISLGVEVAFKTLELLNDRVSLFVFPISNYIDNEIAVINMPWRVGNTDLEGLINPYPEFFMYPVEGSDPAISFGCVDAASYEWIDKEPPMTGLALKIGMKKITGRSTMHDNGPTPSIIHKTFSTYKSTIDFDNSYVIDRKRTESGVEPDVIVSEWSYLNTERSSSYDDITHTSYASAQKFLIMTDGTNKIEKVPYLYYGPDGFHLEIHYTWNGKTCATSVFRYSSFHCTEEFHVFRYFDITTGMMVADVRVTDTAAGFVKWERRIYTPGLPGHSTTHITVFTFTDSENNPISGLPDIRNIPPWGGEDDDNETLGEFSSLMYRWAEPFVANSYANYPASDGPDGIVDPYIYYMATYFPISEEFIFSVIFLEYFKTLGSSQVRKELVDDVTQQNVIVPTEFGWVTCMSSNWYILPGEMVYHYGYSILEKSGGVVRGIDPLSAGSVELYSTRYPQAEYDFIPDPPP